MKLRAIRNQLSLARQRFPSPWDRFIHVPWLQAGTTMMNKECAAADNTQLVLDRNMNK
jgi:hypothetical protein